MPECMKVESPSTATTLPLPASPRALLMPWAMLIEAPMHTQASMADKGGRKPRV